jgi:hypothetical protein
VTTAGIFPSVVSVEDEVATQAYPDVSAGQVVKEAAGGPETYPIPELRNGGIGENRGISPAVVRRSEVGTSEDGPLLGIIGAGL